MRNGLHSSDHDQCRVAFEQWAEDSLLGTGRDDGGAYLSADTETAWAGWYAAWWHGRLRLVDKMVDLVRSA